MKSVVGLDIYGMRDKLAAEGLVYVDCLPAWWLDIEHPTGFFTVDMEVGEEEGKPVLKRSALLRTARMLMTGEVHVPASAWVG